VSRHLHDERPRALTQFAASLFPLIGKFRAYWRSRNFGRSIPVLFEGVPNQRDPLLTSGFTASPVFWPPIRSLTGVFECRSAGVQGLVAYIHY